jgi:ABC-2 type transport system ATP-binding protein
MMLSNIPGVRNVNISDEKKIKVDVPLSFTGVDSIIKVLTEEDIAIAQLISQAPNLETTFLALTGRELE